MNDLIKKENISRYIKIIILISITFFIEIFVFNFNSFYTLLGKRNIMEFNNFEDVEFENDSAVISIDELNVKTFSVKLKLNDNEIEGEEYKDRLEYEINYSDATTDGFFYLGRKRYISSMEKSKYMPMFLSGETKKIKIIINKEIYNNGFLEKVTLNENIPMNFNIYRIFAVFFILLYIIYLRKTFFLQANYDCKNFKQEILLLCIAYVFMALTVYINQYSTEEKDIESENFLIRIFSTEGSVYNKDLVEALKSKKLFLLEDPSDEFKKLKDPYDANGRWELLRDIDYKWDTAYYNGHHFVYFGILPVIIVFLPYNLITKTYLKISILTLLLSVIIFILLEEVLTKLIKMYFKEVPFKIIIFSLIMLCSGSLILYANGMARVYEVVIIARIILCASGNEFNFGF